MTFFFLLTNCQPLKLDYFFYCLFVSIQNRGKKCIVKLDKIEEIKALYISFFSLEQQYV